MVDTIGEYVECQDTYNVAMLVLAPSVVLRMMREDQALTARFTEEHAAYRNRVSALGL